MQSFAASQAVSFSEDFESQILGKFITKNTFLPCSKADFNSGDKDRWICEEIQIHLLSGDC